MAEFPALPLWTDALIGDTYQLTPAEFGAYMRLLIVAWRRPGCDLPNDDAFLGRSVGDPKNWHRLKQSVMPYFTMGSDGFLRQKRLTDERTFTRNIAARSAAGGRGKALKGRHQVPAKLLPNECQNAAPFTTPTPTKIEIAKAISPSKPPKGDFEGFWISCPRKVGKGAARKAYLRAVLKTAPELILAAMQRYAASRAGEPETFTVHPATWLNAERWADEAGGSGEASKPLFDDAMAAEEHANLIRMGIIKDVH